jgi:hypothetical protein
MPKPIKMDFFILFQAVSDELANITQRRNPWWHGQRSINKYISNGLKFFFSFFPIIPLKIIIEKIREIIFVSDLFIIL